ncbi:MAG: hypothetical protein QME51_08890 [Planctomycetota bacterium]|nr:hypothetical protein [Planctomycetota bacterium]MDI6788472.1 hypothetical protein [Planctomycetota bacterium]
MTKEMKFTLTRWIIFILVALAIIIPVIIREKIKLPDTSSKVVKNIYDYIESLPEGAPVILSLDFDPSSDEELRPMATAVLRHCFRKNLRVIGMTIWGPPAYGTMSDIFIKTSRELNKQDGIDFAIMPYKPGVSSVILNLCQDFYFTYPEDHKGRKTKDLAILKGIKSLKDMKYAMCISAGNAVDVWIIFGKEQGRIPLGAGCTGVMATDYYPFLQSKQLIGLVGGLGAASQYEALIKMKGTATESMKPQTVVHSLIIILIIIGNISYFLSRRKHKI